LAQTLICSKTRPQQKQIAGPEMAMACRKAGAIAANEGGINSHAAIVSRELGIPGIVNTKRSRLVF